MRRADLAAPRQPAWADSTAKQAAATRLATGGLWLMVAAGPAGLVLAGASGAAPASSTTTAPAAADGAGPAGFAELFVAAYLQAGRDSEQTLAPFLASPPRLTAQPGSRAAARVVTVSARQVEPGYWAVTVAADELVAAKSGLVPAGTHHYAVAVVAAGGPEAGGAGGAGDPAGYVAVGLPAEVAGPGGAEAPKLAYGSMSAARAGAITDVVERFLGAYLAGQSELDRYLTPGSKIQPVTPPRYTAVEVGELAHDGEQALAPTDGATRRVLVRIEAEDAAGRSWPMSYALTLTARDTRWEVTTVDPAPALAAPATPTAGAAPPPTSTTAGSAR